MTDRKAIIKRMFDNANDEYSAVRFLPVDTIVFSRRFLNENYLCCCMFDYLPYSRRRQPDMQERNVRDVIFEFKKGSKPDIYADMMAAAVMGEPLLAYTPETVLFTIPAATAEKHEKRFKTFSRLLAENLGIVDGFPLLEVIADRNKEKGGIPVLLRDSIRLNDPEGLLQGRQVIITDDIYTTGYSFNTVSRLLMDAGAKDVSGLFLAHSIELDE